MTQDKPSNAFVFQTPPGDPPPHMIPHSIAAPSAVQGSMGGAGFVSETRSDAPLRLMFTAPPTRTFSGRQRVVVSMTSVPKRNGTLGPTIGSLLAQTRRPDEIRLYLGPGCETADGVTCVRVEDRGPVTKLSAVADDAVPADAIVVTADDDITFHPDWLATLLGYVEEHPDDAIGMAGWNADILVRTGVFERAAGPCDVVEGFSGVAYRKWFFTPDVLDPPSWMRFVDDVWISSYLERSGVVRRVVHDGSLFDVHRSVESGIHMRSDFKDLNVRAAKAGFASVARTQLEERRRAAIGDGL